MRKMFSKAAKVAALIAVAGATLFLNTNSIFALTITIETKTTTVKCVGDTGICRISDVVSTGQAQSTTTTTKTTISNVVYNPDAKYYAKCGDTFLSQNEVADLPKTSVFILTDRTTNAPDYLGDRKGIGFINVPYLDDADGSTHYIHTDSDRVFTSYYEWLKAYNKFYGVREIENNLVSVYPNPTSSTTFIGFNPEMVSEIDNGKIIMNLYYNDRLIHSFAADRFDEVITINSDYLVEKGVYHLNCNADITYKDGRFANETFTVSFVVVR